MNVFLSVCEKLSEFKQLRKGLLENETPVFLTGLYGIHKANVIFGLFKSQTVSTKSKNILVITQDENSALKSVADINVMSGEDTAYFYPANENVDNEVTISREFQNMRLSALANDKPKIIIVPVEAVFQSTISKKAMLKSTLIIDEDTQIDTKILANQLTEIGYERTDTVEGAGQFAIHGFIVDIFPVSGKLPIRIELFGDEIDTVSYFDVISQRRLDRLTVFEIPPALETVDKSGNLIDFINGEVVISEYTEVAVRVNNLIKENPKIEKFDNFLEKIKNPLVFMSAFLSGKAFHNLKKIISFECSQFSPWTGDGKQLREDLRHYLSQDYSVVFVAGTEKTLKTIKEDLEADGIPCETAIKTLPDTEKIPKGKVVLVKGGLTSGYEFPSIKCAVITGGRVAESRERKVKKSKKNAFATIADLSPGDLVVHSEYGIGRFIGLEVIDRDGVPTDYLSIQYAGTDSLQISVTDLDMLSRYIAPVDDNDVKLNKLSGVAWKQTRRRVKESVKQMAKELIALYAKREKAVGFAFFPDDDFQQDFEERFAYVETDDQLQCIAEIKKDMQTPRPMERLLCGDVGFGKTEVALRAAFKCVMAGKQCAILAPTTILARQHYYTCINRFEHFPVNIELISRLRTPRQQKEILEKLEKGKIDIIVGTHRLISKDVKFKDIGLVIIDEEQRFGVKQKERFKEMLNSLDVLTLSATPIPRTLNMAMSGIRDMSVIEEPPGNRYPVQTFVTEENFSMLVSAMSKELKRGGQVFYIHNRVETIDICANKIQKAIPEARVAVAHGKMSEIEKDNVWGQMVDGEIDILVCTTIIETGVDVPNANTLIIENADKLGLSQLYQLRGRVGRSNRRSYAYLTFKPMKIVTEIASKRLTAMKEFTQFGSGFRIAMRDLEIRGAGNVLGTSQHGHMEDVGYEMYIKLLNEAIAELKGEISEKLTDCRIDIKINAHIPEDYIESLSGRLEIYRKIANVENIERKEDLIDELIDRFGTPPDTIIQLIEISLARNLASRLGIKQISRKKGQIELSITVINPQQIAALQDTFHNRLTLNGAAKTIGILLAKNQSALELTGQILNLMSKYK